MGNTRTTPASEGAAAGGPGAPRSPFGYQAFTVLWLATVLSNIGTWMHDVGAGWLMTGMSPSPVWVALVQTATTLPVFLLALPAGALADIADRRRVLLIVAAPLGARASRTQAAGVTCSKFAISESSAALSTSPRITKTPIGDGISGSRTGDRR